MGQVLPIVRDGKCAQRLFPSMLQNQSNCFAQVREAFLTRFSLAVGAGHFGAVCDVPGAILLDNRGEFVVHGSILSSGDGDLFGLDFVREVPACPR